MTESPIHHELRQRAEIHNFNDYCSFDATPLGKRIFEEDVKELRKYFRPDNPLLNISRDFQLWEALNTFRSKMVPGLPSVFKDDKITLEGGRMIDINNTPIYISLTPFSKKILEEKGYKVDEDFRTEDGLTEFTLSGIGFLFGSEMCPGNPNQVIETDFYLLKEKA